ncbi:MAG: hypothetical protein R3283_07770, partial [Balneolaceae bacterium]|nr:hypothetical protein [Balneolaceae bacterium]
MTVFFPIFNIQKKFATQNVHSNKEAVSIMPDNEFLEPSEVTYMDKQLMESEEVQKIASEVIEMHKIELGPAQIGYLLVYPNISKQR